MSPSKDRPEEHFSWADEWWDEDGTTKATIVPSVDARLSEDHDTEVHPNQPNPPLDLPPGHLIPHALTKRSEGVPHKKQCGVPIELSPHRIRRQFMIQPTRSKNSKQHRHLRYFLRDQRSNPVSGISSKNNEHPSKELVPALGPEDGQRIRGEGMIEERWPERRGLVEESDT